MKINKQKVKYRCYFSILLLVVLNGYNRPGITAESVMTVMTRMQANEPTRVAYRETRTMALLDQPWQGGGYLYVTPEGLMLKQQTEPDLKLMGVSPELILYYDPVNDVRYRAEMTDDHPMALQTLVFKALLSADQALLHRVYRVSFKPVGEEWVMTLRSKLDPAAALQIDISGSVGQPAKVIDIQHEDGDSSRIELGAVNVNDAVAEKIAQLYRQLIGD